MTETRQILEAALRLAPAQRAVLTDHLLNSLAEQELDDNWSRAWAGEAARRAEEIEFGKVQSIPWARLRDQLRRKLDAAVRD